MRNKNIVLVNQSTGFLMIDIVNAFTKKFGEVILITGNVEKMERDIDTSVKVDKIIKYNKKNAFKRFYTWIWGTAQIFFKLTIKYRKFDVLFVTNPPTAYLMTIVIKNPYSLLIYDTYPDALKNIGISQTNLISRVWGNLNRIIFPKAQSIFTLSKGMAQNLSQYVSIDKIKVIPNWSGSDEIRPIPKEKNRFIQHQTFKDDFIVLYSGNMGYTHSVEVILEVAILLKNEKKLHFVFIGEGKKKTDLIKMAKNNNLSNCSFLPWQDAEMIPFTLSSANLGVVSLNKETAHLSVPSKTYNLMAAGVPLLSISPHDSELSVLIDEYHNGRNFSDDQIVEISEFIIFCQNNPEKLLSMSNQSLVASKNYTYKNALLYL